ncbi:helix-turn-helix transcriptional regulator [Longispora sp. K20-0274]|uniref:helix-turn-helix domain-containing protein n=1 Tax=Longispora sp. K20-0274 TaxID=3088255 RepID=UPI00399ACB2F
MSVSGSVVVRRQLGRRLRTLREASGKTEREVEEAKIISRTKLWRIESGKAAVKIPDVRTLCWFYGADAEVTDALAGLAVATSEQSWFEEYSDVVPEWFKLYVGLEGAAAGILSYDGELVPGPLQTADYARAVYVAAQSRDEAAIDRQVALRLERQEALFRRTPPPRLSVVLGAGVLARQVGGPEVIAAQISHLRELNSRDHVEIRVLSWEAGAHSAMLGAFHVLDFDGDEDPNVVYLESELGGRYPEHPDEIERFRKIFTQIQAKATPLEEYQ